MGLYSLHNCSVSCSLDFFKLKLDAKIRLPILEFFGYHRNVKNFCLLARDSRKSVAYQKTGFYKEMFIFFQVEMSEFQEVGCAMVDPKNSPCKQ